MMQITTRKPTLVDILNNETSYPYSLDDFATFLDQTYCLENLEFYLAVRRYTYYACNFYNYSSSPLSSVGSVESDSFFESPSLLSVVDPTITYYDDDASLRGDAPAHLDFLKQKLHELITTFILPNSPKEVNIPAETRDDLLTNVFQFNNYHPSIFDQVKEHIYELMESSSFTQFLIEAGNVELRMSSESECQEDSDHSSVSGGKDASSKKNNNKSKNSKHTRRFSGLKLKEKYRKLLKTTTNTSSKSRNSLLL